MKLLSDWKRILRRAWSVWLAFLGLVLASADQILAVLGMSLPPLVYAGIYLAVIVARLLYQPTAAADEAGRS